jgi:hypothetical protein
MIAYKRPRYKAFRITPPEVSHMWGRKYIIFETDIEQAAKRVCEDSHIYEKDIFIQSNSLAFIEQKLDYLVSGSPDIYEYSYHDWVIHLWESSF